jgi:hypothetical protein
LAPGAHFFSYYCNLLEQVIMEDETQSGGEEDLAASALQKTTIGVRLHIERLNVRRTLTAEQREMTASTFGAESSSLSATKLVIDTEDPIYRAVSAVLSEITTYWRTSTIDYPVKAVRLLPRDQIGVFNKAINDLAAKLRVAAAELQQHHASLRESARTRLGSLFDPADFPDDLELEFHVDWEFVSVEVPDYLRELNDALYQKERERVSMRFHAAAKLIEESLLNRAKELLTQILTWLEKQPPLDRKPLPPSMVARLVRFVDELRERRDYCDAAVAVLLDRVVPMASCAVSNDPSLAGHWRMHASEHVTNLLWRLNTIRASGV